MHLVHTLTAIDSALGRIDYTTMSDQCLMELLIEGLEEDWKVPFEDSNGDFRDIEEWDALTFSAEGKIEGILMFNRAGGSIAFQYLPKSVKEVDFSECELSGTVEASLLPDGLEYFNVSLAGELSGTFDLLKLPSQLVLCAIAENEFSGSADLTQLPENLENLALRVNCFSGTVSLDALPNQMKDLSLDANKFHGSLDISSLPGSMLSLSACECAFTGTLNFERLPSSLQYLWLYQNEFTGELRLDKIYQMLTDIDVSDNRFEGTAIVHSSLHQYIALNGNFIDEVLDEDGESCPCSRTNGIVDSIVQDKAGNCFGHYF